MRLSDFDYDLPEGSIALRPVEPRSAARLLEITPRRWIDRHVGDLPSLLRADDVLVVNDTKVIPARLFGLRRRRGTVGASEGEATARIEVTLTEPADRATWRALARPAKRLRVGDRIEFHPAIEDPEQVATAPPLAADVVKREPGGGGVVLRFTLAGGELDTAIALFGAPPLPPYIASRRAADAQDRSDYQTVFAQKLGAVAAPTASLHFDAPLLAKLEAAGVSLARVTLHVGAGTFLPVTVDNVAEHQMHAEWGEIDHAATTAIAAARARGGRVIAVGTTALRVLETAALNGPPEPSLPAENASAGQSVNTGPKRVLDPWVGETDLFIQPGFRFRAADALLTNFHLPRSTLLMLVAAFVGREHILSAYAHAIVTGYRFYSYGDATLLWREDSAAGN